MKALEAETGGAVDLVPNIESAAGLLNAYAITKERASGWSRLVGERGHSGQPRCRAQPPRRRACLRPQPLPGRMPRCGCRGVIDCPYTFSDVEVRRG